MSRSSPIALFTVIVPGLSTMLDPEKILKKCLQMITSSSVLTSWVALDESIPVFWAPHCHIYNGSAESQHHFPIASQEVLWGDKRCNVKKQLHGLISYLLLYRSTPKLGFEILMSFVFLPSVGCLGSGGWFFCLMNDSGCTSAHSPGTLLELEQPRWPLILQSLPSP
jgi:hypothetical protein